ncbi:MAG: FecR domain-containing protein [Chloroflexia bacterium]
MAPSEPQPDPQPDPQPEPQPAGRHGLPASAGLLVVALVVAALVLLLTQLLRTGPAQVGVAPTVAATTGAGLPATVAGPGGTMTNTGALNSTATASPAVTGPVATTAAQLPPARPTVVVQSTVSGTASLPASAQASVQAQGTVGGTNSLLPSPQVSAQAQITVGSTSPIPQSPQPSAQAGGAITGTDVLAPTPVQGTGTGTPASGLSVIDTSGAAYLCPHSQGCTDLAGPNMSLGTGGEVRTGPGGTVRLQTPAGLITLGPDSTLRVGGIDDQQTRLTLAAGRVVARSAAGRQSAFVVSSGLVTVTGAGSTFSVSSQTVSLPAAPGQQSSVRVTVPADAAHGVHISSPSTGVSMDVPQGRQVDVLPTGAPTSGPITSDEAAALAALGTGAPQSTPGAVAGITELPIPFAPPMPSGVVTATIVLTPPPDATMVPVTVQPHGETTSTPAAGVNALPVPSAAPSTTAPPAGTPSAADMFAAAFTAMGKVPSYTFGLTNGPDPATAEFGAGTFAPGAACWTVTSKGYRADYQVRGNTVYTRPGTGPWQLLTASEDVTVQLTFWRLLGLIGPATATDLGSSQFDAVTVHHLRAQIAVGSGGASWIGAWLDAFVGADDHLVRSLIIYEGDPKTNNAVFKMGLSSLGDAPPCPPLAGGQ